MGTFNILAKSSIGKNKNLVISKSEKGITIAQQLVIVEEDTGYQNTVFMKGSIHLANKDQLLELRNALNLAIEKL